MATPVFDRSAPVWHSGELTIQRSVGVVDRMEDVGRRFIRGHLLDQHRQFFLQLPFVVIGAVDREGDAWATLIAAKPGFLESPDPSFLRVSASSDPSDPASGGMNDGDAIGLLGIELHTRRRNRLNGVIRRHGASQFDVFVEHSYGNCPQYIQRRNFTFARDPREPFSGTVETLSELDAAARSTIAAADTFFVASYVDREDGARQVDVSHRGGKSGFVRVADDGTLTIPDFAGNLHFNTLGNLLANPKAGLVFVDFSTGNVLQLTGDAEVILDSPEIAAFQGAERLWRFTTRRLVRRESALPLRWAFEKDGWSPNALITGDWKEASERLQASELAAAWRPFRVSKIVDESATIRSFHLEPADGSGLIPHRAGQHLPIRVTLEGSENRVIRTYTLSVAPSDGFYRISVKREGRVSSHLHDTLRVGDILETRAPAGGFTIDAAEKRPAVLVGAGIGVTPMIAMLRHLVYESVRTRHIRPIYFFHAARTKAERAFDRELAALVEAAQGAVNLVRVLSHAEGAFEGRDYDFAGRIDTVLLSTEVPFADSDFYLCGPPAFMQGAYDGLRSLDIANSRIHAEAFGPASLRRTLDPGQTIVPRRAPATETVQVAFMDSAKEARWTPGSGSLLELAEARGLFPDFSCRGGSCGTCRTRIVKGAVAYPTLPTAEVADNEALICCAVPAVPEGSEDGRLQLAL